MEDEYVTTQDCKDKHGSHRTLILCLFGLLALGFSCVSVAVVVGNTASNRATAVEAELAEWKAEQRGRYEVLNVKLEQIALGVGEVKMEVKEIRAKVTTVP